MLQRSVYRPWYPTIMARHAGTTRLAAADIWEPCAAQVLRTRLWVADVTFKIRPRAQVKDRAVESGCDGRDVSAFSDMSRRSGVSLPYAVMVIVRKPGAVTPDRIVPSGQLGRRLSGLSAAYQDRNDGAP